MKNQQSEILRTVKAYVSEISGTGIEELTESSKIPDHVQWDRHAVLYRSLAVRFGIDQKHFLSAVAKRSSLSIKDLAEIIKELLGGGDLT